MLCCTHDADTVYSIEITSLQGFSTNKFIQTLTTTLFHPLKAKNEVDWQWELFFMVVLEHIEPS